MKRTIVVAALAVLAACGEATPAGMKDEALPNVKVELPPVPDFTIPQANPDGSHTVTEVRLRSKDFLDKDIKITGNVVAKYDLDVCAKEQGTKLLLADEKLCAGKPQDECILEIGKKKIADEPTLCDRPYLYLGDTPNASYEKSIWVVEVTRPLREDEKKNDPDAVAAFKKKPPPPVVDVGQRVTIQGKWALKSPLGFGNSTGLLVYGGVVETK